MFDETRYMSTIIPPNYSSWQTIEFSWQCAKYAVESGIPGDFVECGIAAGNNFGAMCKVGRKGWGFDSFVGIPWAGPEDDQQPGMSEKTSNVGLSTSGVSAHSQQDVVSNLDKWGIKDYVLVSGWFQDTLPERSKDISAISVLRLDGDLYQSTMTPLIYLWPKVSPGGILIIDDWALAGCRKAFYDYFKDSPPSSIHEHSGVKYFSK